MFCMNSKFATKKILNLLEICKAFLVSNYEKFERFSSRFQTVLSGCEHNHLLISREI